MNRVGDRGCAGDDGWLANAARAERAVRRWHLDDDYLDVRDGRSMRQRIFHQRAGGHLAVGIVDEALVETPADPLGDRADHLALDGSRIQSMTDILRHDVVEHRDLASLHVDTDAGQLGREARGGCRLSASPAARDGRVPCAEAARERGDLLDCQLVGRVGRHTLDPHAVAEDLQVVWRGLQHLTGKLEDLGLRVLGRSLDCLPDGVGDLAAAAAAGVWRVRAIGADYADEVVVDTNCLGGDHAHRCVGAGEIDRADDDIDHSGCIDEAPCRGRLQPTAPAADGDADSLAVAAIARGRLAPPGPERMILQWQQAVRDADHRPGRAIRAWVAFGRDILQPKFKRVDAELAGQIVHHRLDGEAALRVARRSVGARAKPVGHHLVAADIDVRKVVAASDRECGGRHRRAGVSAGVPQEMPLDCRHLAVPGRADADLDLPGRGWIGRQEVLGAGELKAHRPADCQRRGGSQRLDQAELAAECAADRHGDEANLLLTQPEGLGNDLPGAKHPLGAGVDDNPTHAVRRGDAGLWLDVALMDPGGLEHPLRDSIRRGEAGRDVAHLQVCAAADIGRKTLDRLLLRAPGGDAVHCGLGGVLGH